MHSVVRRRIWQTSVACYWPSQHSRNCWKEFGGPASESYRILCTLLSEFKWKFRSLARAERPPMNTLLCRLVGRSIMLTEAVSGTNLPSLPSVETSLTSLQRLLTVCLFHGVDLLSSSEDVIPKSNASEQILYISKDFPSLQELSPEKWNLSAATEDWPPTQCAVAVLAKL